MIEREDFDNVVFVDIDSTLANTAHRQDKAPEDPINGDWSVYANLCDNDTPIEGTVALVRLLYPTRKIVICSGRTVAVKSKTIKWFEIEDIPYDEIHLLEPEMWNKFPSNAEAKLFYINMYASQGYTIDLVIEDWPETALAIEKAGYPVLCVNPRYSHTMNLCL